MTSPCPSRALALPLLAPLLAFAPACERDPDPVGQVDTDTSADASDSQDSVGSDASDATGSDSAESSDAESDSTDAESSESTDSTESDTGEPTSWRSALYPQDWTPAFTDPRGRFLHDFSYAGYHNGEDEPPQRVPGLERSVLDDGADPTGESDSTAAIQATIDAVSQSGGGVVYLPAGSYRCDGLLEVNASAVVVRGAGPDQTFVWFTRDQDMTGKEHLTVRGAATTAAEIPLAVDGEARSTSVSVAAADIDALAVGDDVLVGWVITDDFVSAHGMDGTWMAFNGQWRPFFRREVLAIDCALPGEPLLCALTLDVPLRYPALVSDQASVRVEIGALSEVGVESLALSTVSASFAQAWALDRTHALGFIGVKDAWVRDVASFESPNSGDDKGRHLISGGILIRDSKRVTVTDSVMSLPQNRGGGGNGYLFEISRSGEVLTRDSEGYEGRHNFIQNWDFGATGCVWQRIHSEGSVSHFASSELIGLPAASEFHHSLAMANLIEDSTIEDGWYAANRNDYSSGAGHSATQNVLWNNLGSGRIKSYQWGWGYVIGTSGLIVQTVLEEALLFESLGTAPVDWVEGVDAPLPLDPPSLYEDQLTRRLGG